MDPSSLIPTFLGIAVLLPLASFVVILCTARYLKEQAAWVAICAIGGACLLSFISMFLWLGSNWPKGPEHGHSAGPPAEQVARMADDTAGEYFVSTSEEPAKEKHEGAKPEEKAHGDPADAKHSSAKPGPYTDDAVSPF